LTGGELELLKVFNGEDEMLGFARDRKPFLPHQTGGV
jgi:hypothetical protein